MKKSIIMILMVSFTLQIGLACAEHITIQELKTATPARWRKTYQAHGRTVMVDVEVKTPDVDAFPVVTVRRPAEKTPLEALEAFTKIYGNERGHLGGRIGREFDNIANVGQVKQKQKDIYYDGVEPTTLPEDNPVKYEHALQSVTSRILELTGLRYSADYSLIELRVMGRYYQYSQKKGQDIWGRPKTDTGYYSFYFEPSFYGIPCPTNGFTGYMAASYANDEAMSLVLFFTEESHREYGNVPLCSFEDVRATLENVIQSGRLRSIESVQLCYAPFQDPRDSDQYWLLPVWQVRGLYAESAEYEWETFPDKQGKERYAANTTLLYVMGQDGRLVEAGKQALYGSGDVQTAMSWDDLE